MKPAPPVIMNRLCIKVSRAEGRNKTLKKRKNRVLFGNRCVNGTDRPRDRQVGIVPTQARVACRRIEGIYFVGDLGILFKRAKAMREASRHENLFAAVSRQRRRTPAAVTGTAAAQIDRHIEDCAAHDPDQFGLGCRRALKMQAPDGSGFSRQGLVVLDENTSDASLRVSPRVEGFEKKSARVGEFLRSKKLYAFEHQRFRAPS